MGGMVNRYYLIGIKGTGMSALALSLKGQGYEVVGSDVQEVFFTDEALNENKIPIFIFNEDNIKGDYIYIISAAYDYHNVEVKKIINEKYKYYYYHDFIDQHYHGVRIGVSGTHGKTTTTRMLSHFLDEGNICSIIGDGEGIGTKNYDYFLFEACEYKNNFLHLNYDYLIINNIDFDHPDFFPDLQTTIKSFQKVANKSKVIIINGDDENCQKIIHPHKYTFGKSVNNDLYYIVEEVLEKGYKVKIFFKNEEHRYYLPFLGEHMIYNFLSSLLAYYLLQKNFNIQEKLITYKNPRRRMEEYYYYTNIIIDDYAHHPTEIKACLKGIKLKYPDKKIIVFFEPHTYTRTLALGESFLNAFHDVDELYLAKTFTSKREKYSRVLEKEVIKMFPKAQRYNIGLLKKIKNYENTVIVFMGAGNIRKNIKTILNYT